MKTVQTSPHPLRNYDGKMNTVSRRKFNIANPDPNGVYYKDIVSGLSKTCHFGAQIEPFFSVAQHSVMVTELVPRALRKVALLHDAAEAYCGDMIKPIKVLLPEFKERIETPIQKAIFQHYGLDYNDLKKIKEADDRVQEIEYDFFYKDKGHIDCWSIEKSHQVFEKWFLELFNKP